MHVAKRRMNTKLTLTAKPHWRRS